MPSEWENAGADKQRKMGEKVAEIEFFEVGNHAGNGHLSADKVLRQSVRPKKDAYIVARDNSIFSEILMVDFELFRDFAGQKHQNLRKIPREPRNLRIIAAELSRDFDI